MPVLIDKKDNNLVEYDVTYVDSKSFGALNNPLASKIIAMLAISPMCAIDISRKLEQPEHKIYYHLNKLNRAGLIKLVGTEKRYGMVAQLYDLISPVIASKMSENGKLMKKETSYNNDYYKFFDGFIENGKLNSKIIIGDTSPHGKYERGSHQGNYIVDFSLLVGSLVNNLEFPYLKLDTEVNDLDLRNNLILIGSQFNNTVIDKIIDKIPIQLEENTIVTKRGTYDNNIIGYIIKIENPFDTTKKILVIGGVTGKGIRSSIVAITRCFDEVFSNLLSQDKYIRLVEGIDKDGDRVIDSVKIIE